MTTVIGDQSITQCIGGFDLKVGIQCGSDRHAAFIKFCLAVLAVELTAHLFHKIVCINNLGTLATRCDHKVFGTGNGGLIGGDKAVFFHAADYPVTTGERTLAVAIGMIPAWRFWQRGKIGGLRNGQLI